MQSRHDLPPQIRHLVRLQEGVVAREQLIQAGLSRRCIERLTRGWWRLARGVYLVGAELECPPWRARVWAGVLLGGEGARACRLTAAALDGLVAPEERLRDPSGRWRSAEEVIEVVSRARRGPHAGFVFVREQPGVRLASSAREPVRTRIEDTVLDLCAAADEERLVMWLTRACQRRLTTVDRLRNRLVARPLTRNRFVMLEILEDVSAGATSNLEHRALRQVFRPHALPAVTMQYRTGSGRCTADAAIPAYRLLIEFDGRVGHVAEGAFRDRARDNQHALDGWLTLRFGWSDVAGDPCAVAAQIGEMLISLGWPGPFQSCRRCRS